MALNDWALGTVTAGKKKIICKCFAASFEILKNNKILAI